MLTKNSCSTRITKGIVVYSTEYSRNNVYSAYIFELFLIITFCFVLPVFGKGRFLQSIFMKPFFIIRCYVFVLFLRVE